MSKPTHRQAAWQQWIYQMLTATNLLQRAPYGKTETAIAQEIAANAKAFHFRAFPEEDVAAWALVLADASNVPMLASGAVDKAWMVQRTDSLREWTQTRPAGTVMAAYTRSSDPMFHLYLTTSFQALDKPES